MTDREIEVMRARIEAATAERDRLFRGGAEAEYLDAYVIVKALELELTEMLAQQRRHSMR